MNVVWFEMQNEATGVDPLTGYSDKDLPWSEPPHKKARLETKGEEREGEAEGVSECVEGNRTEAGEGKETVGEHTTSGGEHSSDEMDRTCEGDGGRERQRKGVCSEQAHPQDEGLSGENRTGGGEEERNSEPVAVEEAEAMECTESKPSMTSEEDRKLDSEQDAKVYCTEGNFEGKNFHVFPQSNAFG